MYCPSFKEQECDELWGNANGFNNTGYRVLGYATTFPGTASLSATNQNPSILSEPIKDPATGLYFSVPGTDRVLLADGTISKPGENVSSLRGTYAYVGIKGGWTQLHRTAHLSGRLPSGGNLAMLDGHVEWRKFNLMLPRTDINARPVFWW
jgi:prepilin-type processing-associated H-X9-DG protein